MAFTFTDVEKDLLINSTMFFFPLLVLSEPLDSGFLLIVITPRPYFFPAIYIIPICKDPT